MQNYVTGAEDEYVILGNTAVIKCKVPSFVADFVSIESWVSSDGQEYHNFSDRNGTYLFCTYLYLLKWLFTVFDLILKFPLHHLDIYPRTSFDCIIIYIKCLK